jgi:hypothetical protein
MESELPLFDLGKQLGLVIIVERPVHSIAMCVGVRER